MRPIIEAKRDQSGGILLTTSDQWAIEDLAESIVKHLGIAELRDLQIALLRFDAREPESVARLDNARYNVAQSAKGKENLIIARLLPHELVAINSQIQTALSSSQVDAI